MLIQDAEDHGCSHCIVIDSDEYYTRKSFEYALQQIDEHDYEITYCQYVNYYHDYMHYLRYPFAGGMYVPFVTKVKYRHSFDCKDFNRPSDPTRRFVRPYNGKRYVLGRDGQTPVEIKNYTVDFHVFEWNEVKMHHLSWIRADIRKKLENWSSKKVFENFNDHIDKAVWNFKNFDPNKPDAMAVMLFNTPDNKIEIASFPKQFIHPAVDYMTRVRPVPQYRKMLVLSMSADCEPFNTLEQVSNETWRNIDRDKYPNVNVQFWTYTDAKQGEKTHHDAQKHIIYIERDSFWKDNLINATYSKTIEALRYVEKVLKLDYDYLIRTNNSTWLNIPLIGEFLARQNDDSRFYGGEMFAAFWSAFNPYMGGELMIFSRRNVIIVCRICGEVKECKEFERKIVACDDNMIFGKINLRSIQLGIPYKEQYHTLGGHYFKGDDIDEEIVKRWDSARLQIKTFGCADSKTRSVKDSEKMRKVDALWRECDVPIEEMYNRLMENSYDKTVNVQKTKKNEWMKMSDEEKEVVRFNCAMPRDEAFEFLKEFQKKQGYQAGMY